MKNDFDAYAQNYNQILQQQLKFFSGDVDYFAEYKIKRMANLVGVNILSILEYGCGVGRNLGFIKKYFPKSQIFAFDPSLESIDYAKKNNSEINFCDLTQISSMKFDLIFVAGVFHHIEPSGRKEEMKKIYNLLSSNGQLFIFEHNPRNPITRYMVKTCPFDAGVSLCYPKELVNLAQCVGFKYVKKEYCLFFPQWGLLKLLHFFEPSLKHCPLGGQYFIRLTRG